MLVICHNPAQLDVSIAGPALPVDAEQPGIDFEFNILPGPDAAEHSRSAAE